MSNDVIFNSRSRTRRLIEGQLRKALYEFKMLQENTGVVVALSGGKDSLTALILLNAVSGYGFPKFDIKAVNISGKFSCGASVSNNFLEFFCDKLGVKLFTIKSEYDSDNPECYSCSRIRRNLLFKEAKRLGANTVVFGHHRDDSAQTVLMNLAHKAEFSGILPVVNMVKYGIKIIRPLIFVKETDIITFAKESKFSRITCKCPVDSLRKKAKEQIQILKNVFPDVESNLALAALLYGSQKAAMLNLNDDR